MKDQPKGEEFSFTRRILFLLAVVFATAAFKARWWIEFSIAVAAMPLILFWRAKSILDSFFGRKRRVPVVPAMDARLRQAVIASQQDAILAAEQKLDRPLTDTERRGIESITSLMTLESCFRAFSSPVSTQTEVLVDLEHFAKEADGSGAD